MKYYLRMVGRRTEGGRFIKEFRQIPEREKNVSRIYPKDESPAFDVYTEIQKRFGGDLEELIVFSDRNGEDEEIKPLIFEKNGSRFSAIKQIHALALEGKKDAMGKWYVPLIVRRGHHRAAELPLEQPIMDQRKERYGKKEFDSFGVYGVINIKGPGFIFPEGYQSKKEGYYGAVGLPTVETKPSDEEYAWGYMVLGMFDKRVFDTLRESTENIIRYGGRVENIVAAYEIKSCFYKGMLVSIESLKEEGIIPKESYEDLGTFEPLEVFRLQRVNTRVKDFVDAGVEEKKEMLTEAFEFLQLEYRQLEQTLDQVTNETEKSMLNTVMKRLSKEYDINNPRSVRTYLENTAYWIGKNLGTIESLGKFALYFNSGNITLACGELVDLDSVGDIKALEHVNKPYTPTLNRNTGEKRVYTIPAVLLKDIRDALFALKMLISDMEKAGLLMVNHDECRLAIQRSFLDGHLSGFVASDRLRKKEFKRLDMEDILQTVGALSETLIINDQTIAPIKMGS